MLLRRQRLRKVIARRPARLKRVLGSPKNKSTQKKRNKGGPRNDRSGRLGLCPLDKPADLRIGPRLRMSGAAEFFFLSWNANGIHVPTLPLARLKGHAAQPRSRPGLCGDRKSTR